MTLRKPVSIPYVRWVDGQKVDQDDMVDEQNRDLQSEQAIVNNFFGSGLMPEALIRRVLFDSDSLDSTQQQYYINNEFDGRGISPHAQPSDLNYGNQLEITLSDANVSLRRSVKICVIGTDFENNSQYETFYFNSNETQVGKKHFKTIITLLFNDFKGNQNGSVNLGGSLIIREAKSMELSRDEIIASQNLEPNLFFRDFKVVDQSVGPNASMVLYQTLLTALGSSGYTVDSLNINIGYVNKKNINANDISTRYGQKFKAKTTNIQKVKLLLGIDKDSTAPTSETWFEWSGDIIISIHELQTSVTCPTDTIPDNAIDYQPNPSPIAQVVLTKDILFDNYGYTLTDIAQPVDIYFTNTRVGGFVNTGITINNYYVVTIQRAGDTSSGNLFTLTGRNLSENSVFTQFNGSTWVDNPNDDLWFEIQSDSMKVASGYGYDSGVGISIDKTKIDSQTAATFDYSYDGVNFLNNGQNINNYVVVQAINELKDQVQDSRTGAPIYSRYQSSAEISCITSAQLNTLMLTEEPIILGCGADTNNKITASLTKTQTYVNMGSDNQFWIVNPSADFMLYNLVGAKFIPNTLNANAKEYLIYKTVLCTDGYGDLNGDGYIGADDILRFNDLLGEDISTLATQQKIVAGTFSILEFLRADVDGDGIISGTDLNYIESIYNKRISTILPHGDTFQRITLYLENLNGRYDGYHSSYDGYARIWDPQPRIAEYNVDPLLIEGTNTIYYYGYPSPVDVINNEPALYATPFTNVSYQIQLSPKWQRDNLKVNYTGRMLPCSFTDMIGITKYSCDVANKTGCSNINYGNVSCSGGRNDMFVPDNLYIENGQILNTDGTHYPIDFEQSTITLNLPDTAINGKSLDLFTLFIKEGSAGNGLTSAGYPAMKFADCSYVQSDALNKNQLRFSVSIESLAQNIDGYDISIVDGYGAIVDPLVGTYIDNTTGVLTIRSTNVLADSTDITLNSKITITVFIKKAGWKNNPLIINNVHLVNLLS